MRVDLLSGSDDLRQVLVAARPGHRVHWETFPLEGPVKLLSWTRVWNLPDGYNVKFLLFGIVEFDNGLRAAGRIGVAEPTVGMTLNSRVEESDERPGKPVNIFVFE